MGPCAGGAVYSPAITDFIFMVKNTSYMFVTGPDVIKAVTHEEVTFEELGGADDPREHLGRGPLRGRERGGVPGPDPRAADASCPRTTWRTRPLRPDAGSAGPRGRGAADGRARSARTSPTTSRSIIRTVLDDQYFFEVQPDYAPNIVIGFGRLERPAGRHRRQPARAPGRLPRHQRLAQGRALRPLLRLLQHPARDLRGRARASCPGRPRSTAASSSTAPSCSTPSARRRCPSSR